MMTYNCDVIEKCRFQVRVREKRDRQYFGHNFDKFNFFARNTVKNAKLLTQQKSASPNQCRYFTLQIRQ